MPRETVSIGSMSYVLFADPTHVREWSKYDIDNNCMVHHGACAVVSSKLW